MRRPSLGQILFAAALAVPPVLAAACGGNPTETQTATSNGEDVQCTDGTIDGANNQKCNETWNCEDGAAVYTINCLLETTGEHAGMAYACNCSVGGTHTQDFSVAPFECGGGEAIVTANMGCGWTISEENQ